MKPHRARILAMQALFQSDFQQRGIDDLGKFDWIDFQVPEDEKKFALKIIGLTYEHLNEIDEKIKHFSRNWDFDRISVVNKSILRISMAQLLYLADEIPPKVVIDEAIRLAKEYAEDDASRFINGVLDGCYKSLL